MQASPRILAFDTSGPYCMAAILAGDRVAARRREEMKKGQAERLMPMLSEVLADAGTAWDELDAIGVGVGPGNFTGIRISVSAARGLAMSLGIPAVGVNAFEAMAYGTEGVVIAAVDMPREQVCACVMHHVGAGPIIGAPSSLEIDVPAGAEPKCIGAVADVLASRFAGRVSESSFPAIEAIARLAGSRMNDEDLPRPAPLYVRPADAAPASDPPPVILP